MVGDVQFLTLILALAVATGCGRVTTTPADAGTSGPFGAGQRSGTRLKLEYYEFEGARQILGIHDSTRQEACQFRPWSDGNSYCAPFADAAIVFSDATCTTKVGRGSSNPCDPAKYFAETTADCDGNLTYSHLYPAGEKRSLDRYFIMNDSVCTEKPADGIVFHALGPEIGVGELVRGTIGAPEGSGRIQARFASSSDGLRIAVSPAFDSVLGVDCYLQNDGWCRPLTTDPPRFYKDPSCTMAAVQVDNRCPKKFLIEPDSCSFRSVGAKIPTASGYVDSGVCRMVPLPADLSLFEIGAKVTLPTLARKPVDNGSRIRRIGIADLDFVDNSRMYDHDKQAECQPGSLADGSVYCFPAGGSMGIQYYSDSGCNTPVDILAISATKSRCESTSVPPFMTKSTFDPTSCTSTFESRPVGAQHAGQLYDKSARPCSPVSPLFTYYDVGPPLPLTELAKGALRVDESPVAQTLVFR